MNARVHPAFSPLHTIRISHAGATLAVAMLFLISFATADPTPYQSVWAKLYPETLPTDETSVPASPVFVDFYSAAGSKELEAATKLWEEFQKKHPRVASGFEDAVHERLWKWSDQELKRCRFFSEGKPQEAAAVEAELRELAESGNF